MLHYKKQEEKMSYTILTSDIIVDYLLAIESIKEYLEEGKIFDFHITFDKIEPTVITTLPTFQYRYVKSYPNAQE